MYYKLLIKKTHLSLDCGTGSRDLKDYNYYEKCAQYFHALIFFEALINVD